MDICEILFPNSKNMFRIEVKILVLSLLSLFMLVDE